MLYRDFINEGRLDRVAGLVSDEVETDGGGRGRSAFVGNIESLRSGFPDIRFSVEDLVGEGDRVVIRWKWEGTHLGQFRQLAPTQKRITTSGIAIHQLRAGKITRMWLETDRLGVLQQVGVVPRS